MSGIHRTIFNRLLAAWVVVSLLTSAAVSWLGLSRIDKQLVELAAEQVHKITATVLPLLDRTGAERAELNRVAAEFVRQHAVVVEFQDRNRNRMAMAINPLHADLEQELRGQPYSFAADGKRHSGKFAAAGQSVLRILVPLKDPAGGVAGYFEGSFLVDQETLARLRGDLIVTLLTALVAVTLTTVCLYPIILSLNRDVIRYSNDLLKGNVELMEVVGSAVAKRDAVTSIHNHRVTSYAVRLAEARGLKHGEIRDLMAGAFLHDVGKIGISDTILRKPGDLDEQEAEIMKSHVTLGVDILRKSNWLQKARDVVEFHHEKFDGSGYHQGLAGEAIPLAARVFTVVDVFDALTSKRSYKEPISFAEAIAIIEDGAGSFFDPRVTAAFSVIAEALYSEIGNAPDAVVESRLQELIAKYFFASR